jgi:hypothetical protein
MKRTRILVTIAAVLIAASMVVGCGQAPVLMLSEASVEVNAGASTEITATATDKMGATDTISVESDDESVATVSASGLTITITGVSAGTATITVTSGSEQTATCDVTVNDIEVMGTWLLEGAFGDEKWIISNSTIEYQSDYGSGFSTNYKAEIVEFVNGSFNAGDTAIAAGGPASDDPGYAVIKYTEVANAGWGEDDKYNIFRWCDNADDATNKDFAQGSKDTDPEDDTYINDVFDSASAAKSGATNTAGYFGFASSGAVKQ